MLRKTHTFCVLLMQHEKHNLPFLTPLCGKNDETKAVFSLQGCCKSQFCASHAPYEALFFVLLMQHEKHNFEIDLTPSV